MKTKAQQFEMAWDRPEDFRLVAQTTLDGDRVTAERQAKAQAELEQEKKQTAMFLSELEREIGL